MKKLLLALALVMGLAMALPASGLAISEAEYNEMMRSSAALKEADKKLNAYWKKITAESSREGKKHLLKIQREWLKVGRDKDARLFLAVGLSKPAAYARATYRWIKVLMAVHYNNGLDEENMGRAKTDEYYFEPEDYPDFYSK